MLIDDKFVVRAPREAVWRFMVDPKRMLPCIPGCESIEQIGPAQYRAAVKLEVGPIRTRFNLEVTIDLEEPPALIRSTTRGEEGTRASTLSAKSSLALAALDERTTEVSYSSDLSVVGRLGRFGLGMMKKKAQALGTAFADALRERIEADVMADAR
jgi:carbon monoxide dehydrogenase subunit G